MAKFNELSIDDKNIIASILEFNNKKEADARQFYFELINKVADEHKPLIKEIIEDEQDHSIILERLVEIYSTAQPTEFESLLRLRKKEGE